VQDDFSCATILEVAQRNSADASAALVQQGDGAAELDNAVVVEVDTVMVIKPAPDLEMVPC